MKSFGNDLLASLDGDAANANAALRAAMPSPVVMVPEKDDAGPLFRVAGTVKVAENQSCGGRILTCDLRVMSSLRGHRSQSLRLTTLRNPYRTDERTWPILSRRYLRFPRILGPLVVRTPMAGAIRIGSLLTVKQVAARLAVSAATVYGLCERRELHHVRVANAIRVSPDALEAFLRTMSAVPPKRHRH